MQAFARALTRWAVRRPSRFGGVWCAIADDGVALRIFGRDRRIAAGFQRNHFTKQFARRLSGLTAVPGRSALRNSDFGRKHLSVIRAASGGWHLTARLINTAFSYLPAGLDGAVAVESCAVRTTRIFRLKPNPTRRNAGPLARAFVMPFSKFSYSVDGASPWSR